jgi:hypothetical protein
MLLRFGCCLPSEPPLLYTLSGRSARPLLPQFSFLGTILSAVFGWREFQIESHLEGMREYGRFAASIGRPSDFYKKEHINVDVADEIAIMQGWDLGWKEFRDLPKEQQALSAEQNRRAPPQPLFDRSAPASHTDSQNHRGKQSARRTE